MLPGCVSSHDDQYFQQPVIGAGLITETSINNDNVTSHVFVPFYKNTESLVVSEGNPGELSANLWPASRNSCKVNSGRASEREKERECCAKMSKCDLCWCCD